VFLQVLLLLLHELLKHLLLLLPLLPLHVLLIHEHLLDIVNVNRLFLLWLLFGLLVR